MRYAQAEWNAELAGWKCVIQMNLLKSVITILDALQAEQDGEPVDEASGETEFLLDAVSTSQPTAIITSRGTFHGRRPSVPGINPFAPAARRVGSGSNLRQDVGQASTSTSPPPSGDSAGQTSTLLTGKHQLLKLRLAPLRRVEQDLRRRLSAEEDIDLAFSGGSADPQYGPFGNITNSESGVLRRRATKEFSVRRVKDALEGSQQPPSPTDGNSEHPHSARSDKDADDATEVIFRSQEDIKALWEDETVRLILKKRRIRLEESAGLYVLSIPLTCSRP